MARAVVERLFSFTDPESGQYGSVALSGEQAAAVLTGESGVVEIDGGAATRKEGILRVESDAGTLVLGLVAQTTALAFEVGESATLELQSIGVSSSFSGDAGEAGFEATGVGWALSGDDTSRSLRALWAISEGRLLAMFALREAGAGNHGSETVGAVRISTDGNVLAYDEPLLSTEYDAAGRQTRATLELWGGSEGAVADRGGGKRLAGGTGHIGNSKLEAAAFAWSIGGTPGAGAYEIYTR
jgi:hypothetical protein